MRIILFDAVDCWQKLNELDQDSEDSGAGERRHGRDAPIYSQGDATHANGGTIGFSMSGPEQADAWHKAGVANGGRSIEDPPGVRQRAAGQLYLAYLRDPDGNKLCALYRVPAA